MMNVIIVIALMTKNIYPHVFNYIILQHPKGNSKSHHDFELNDKIPKQVRNSVVLYSQVFQNPPFELIFWTVT